MGRWFAKLVGKTRGFTPELLLKLLDFRAGGGIEITRGAAECYDISRNTAGVDGLLGGF